MRISDWSSDVCSSDLSYPTTGGSPQTATEDADEQVADQPDATPDPLRWTDKRVRPWMLAGFLGGQAQAMIDRKRVVSGKSVSVRVDLGGRRLITNQKKER